MLMIYMFEIYAHMDTSVYANLLIYGNLNVLQFLSFPFYLFPLSDFRMHVVYVH